MDLAKLMNSRAKKRPSAAPSSTPPSTAPTPPPPKQRRVASRSRGEDHVELPKLPPYPLPRTTEELALWPYHLLQRAALIFGEKYVIDRICTAKMRVFDLFGGCLCARQAWLMLESAALKLFGILEPDINFTFTVEINKACQKLSMASFPDSCVFPDMLKLVVNTGSDDENWTPSKLRLKKSAFCLRHKKECQLGINRNDVGVLGAPCILFSRYGKQEGFSNKTLKKVHDASTRVQSQVDLSIHENVPQYDEGYLDQNLRNHFREETQLCSFMFGHPNKRCQQRHLDAFRARYPEKVVYDLSANCDKRPGVESAEKTLPCLTTSAQFWSEASSRMFLGKEQLFALGYPCVPQAADTAGVDLVDVSDYTEASLRKMGGNGMALPQAGFVMLMAILCVGDA